MHFDLKGFLFFLKIGVFAAAIFLTAEFSPQIFSFAFNRGAEDSANLKIADAGKEINSARLNSTETAAIKKIETEVNSDSAGLFRKIGGFQAINILVHGKKKAIGADLEKMKLITYENGNPVKEYNIISKGRPGSTFETPTGEYKVNFKQEKHFSSIGKVWMPYSIQFYGNFFIHGWPYYPDNSLVPKGYSGGCIRLNTEDAKEVFDFSEKGMPIFVYDGGLETNSGIDFNLAKISEPEVSAKSYLVADILSGSVFLERESKAQMPIASLTKLMTSVVASESIFFERTVKISKEMVETYGDSGNLKVGEELSLNDLFYPLLMESSNDAAKAVSLMASTEKYFVFLMNDKASALGMKDTVFNDASGISNKNVSTAEDLFRLSKYIFSKRSFLWKITAEPQKKIVSKDGSQAHTFNNFNSFSGDKNFVGGKTGYTRDANGTMASIFNVKIGGKTRPVALIVLNSDNREQDTKALLNWIKESGTSALPAPAATAAGENSVRLGFAGDTMLDRGVLRNINYYGKGDFSYPFQRIAGDLKKYDLLFGNLEGPISDTGENKGSIYSFRMDPKSIEGLKFAGFKAMSTANNHIGDWGVKAMEDTFKRLDDAGILNVGAGKNKAEALSPKILEVKGIKIAFLGFSQFGKNYLEAKENLPGIAIISPETEDAMARSIKEAKKTADILVVSFHFGEEYKDAPNSYQIHLSELAADSGADLVIGHHPHVIEPFKKYKDSYIAYSLGNFVFDQPFSESTMRGMILDVSVDKISKKIISAEPKKFKISKTFQPYFE